MTVEIVEDLRVAGRRMHVAMRPGSGTPLLICNGIGAGIDLLQPFVDALDPAIPVIRFDAPGIGGSEPPVLPYNFGTLALHVGMMLDELGIGDVDVLGISWGGALAQQFAFMNPRRCRRLVLVSTAAGVMMVPGSPRVLSSMLTPRRYRDPQYAASIAGTIYGGEMRERPELVHQVMQGHQQRSPSSGYAMQLLAAAMWTSLPFLGMIRQPTLLMAGDDDPLVPLVNAKVMARLLPNAQLHVYHDGHLGLLTKADELSPTIARFLRPAV